jgi:molybdopterin-guanine dinucleotide biosynthesis protein A
MGRDKAFLEFDGEPLWRRQLETLKKLSPVELMISGPRREEWREFEIVSDEIAGAGPLAGVAAALRKCSAPSLVVLAVDLPRITPDFLHSLGEGAVPRSPAGLEPLAAVYPATCLPLALQALQSGDFSMQNFVRRGIDQGLLVEHKISEAESLLFTNLNTPADL